MQNEVLWRGKRLRIVSESWESQIKCEPCVCAGPCFDEYDAPLDERNARRFAEMLKDFSKRSQFIVVTHNRATMEAADILYGITLNEDGTSKILSLKLASEPAG